MKLRLDQINGRVITDQLRHHKLVRHILRARPAGYKYSKKFKSGKWDGWLTLYQDMKFPAGLASYLQKELLEKYKIEVEIEYTYPRMIIDEIYAYLGGGFVLRDNQYMAVERVFEHRNCVLNMATNAGKTFVAASIIKSSGNKAVYIVPSRPLMYQTAKDLGTFLNMAIGMFGDGHRDFKDVNVVLMHSLKRLLENDLSENRVLIIDECHRSSAETLYGNVHNIPAEMRIGMSGTPLKYDKLSDMKLIGITGPVVYTIRNKDLIRDGYSVAPKVVFHVVEGQENGKVSYPEAYKKFIVFNDKRNNLIANIALDSAKNGEKTMILVNWKMQCWELQKRLPNAIIATGEDSGSEIMDKLKQFNATPDAIMIATPVFKEGINVPDTRSLILAGGGKGHIQLLQRIGRGLRTAKGKKSLIVHDFLDDTNDYLLNHVEARLNIYEDEGFHTEIKDPKS